MKTSLFEFSTQEELDHSEGPRSTTKIEQLFFGKGTTHASGLDPYDRIPVPMVQLIGPTGCGDQEVVGPEWI